MASSRKSNALGNGIDALFGEEEPIARENLEIDISKISPNRKQPRKNFEVEPLEELSASIAEHGVLQPILVRPDGEDHYQIISGERRFRAAFKAGLHTIPAIIKTVSSEEEKEIALIENLQRENLNPIEEALGYKDLMDTCDYTQEEAARRVGKSRPAVANAMRLLTLPNDVVDLLQTGKLTAGHAKAILMIGDPNVTANSAKMSDFAKQIVSKGMSVREAEKLCRPKTSKTVKKGSNLFKPASTLPAEVEESLKEILGVNVKVNYNLNKDGSLTGTLCIDFCNGEQLQEFANKLGK